jgi:hypothetical protein
MNKKILSLVVPGILSLPLLVSAQLIRTPSPVTLADIMHSAEEATGLIFGAIAVVCFVIAGILLLTAQGAPEKLHAAKMAVIWGFAGVVVGILAFSIVALVASTLNI